MRATRVLAGVDGWLFAPGPPLRLEVVRRLVALLIGVRLALWGYWHLAGQPPPLFIPQGVISLLFDRMPPLATIVALQVGGTTAAMAVTAGRARRWGLPLAWACLLVLAGLRGSLGKILHNDVLVLLATVPLLVAPAERRAPEERAGWPVRAAMVVVAGSYLFTGVAKVVHSGMDWVTSDNMRWVMAEAARDPRGPIEGVARFIAGHGAVAHAVAAAILALELAFPLVLFRPRLAPLFLAGAVAFHAGTWITLGLDYWGHLAVVAIVLVEWDRLSLPRSFPRISGTRRPA
ncbi:MAG TPA: hypothetical protein VMZ73_03580 [Acidimicrobiales bacterium]|nr:hypothetical protein [Acidimicrobiales bacterium]